MFTLFKELVSSNSHIFRESVKSQGLVYNENKKLKIHFYVVIKLQ